MAHTLTETGNINRSSEVQSNFCMSSEWQKMVVATSIHTFPGSLSNNGRLQYQLPKHKICRWFWFGEKKGGKKKYKGMQNRSRSTMSSGASCAVNGCNYSQRNLNNLLPMQCFNRMPLLRKECWLHKMWSNADTKREQLSAWQKNLSTEKLTCLFLSFLWQKVDRRKYNVPEHLCFTCPMSPIQRDHKPCQKY